MRVSTLTFAVFRFLLPPAIIATVVLYLYPAVQNCSFPTPPAKKTEAAACLLDGSQSTSHVFQKSQIAAAAAAPFRLLALGDPQLEGDTSLPDPTAPAFPSLLGLGAKLTARHPTMAFTTIKRVFEDVGSSDIPALVATYRKRLDLWGNDLYLAHIHRLVSWWTAPTHTVVLGDLVGSQWISDAEFERRADRFWGRVFVGMEKVEDEMMMMLRRPCVDGESCGEEISERGGIIGSAEYGAWEKRLIAVAGNHDIGYAGDIDHRRIDRFERRFGRVNYSLRFELPQNHSSQDANSQDKNTSPRPALDLIVLNDMNLDGPAWQQQLQEQSRNFLHEATREAGTEAEAEQRDNTRATVLLTHIPLSKDAGVCVDPPFFDHFPADQGGGIREQNHLSAETSSEILDTLFGGSAGGIVLNGHDHEGCDTYHSAPLTDHNPDVEGGDGDGDSERSWSATRYAAAQTVSDDEDNKTKRGVREITVRSMMGSYGGNAGLLSAWFDEGEGVWEFEYATCVLGVQHIWWAVHVLDVVVVLLGLTSLAAFAVNVLLQNTTRAAGVADDKDRKTR